MPARSRVRAGGAYESASMRILSDFDGVWTDQAAEARFIQRRLALAAAPILGIEIDEAVADFDAFLAATLAAPGENGWWPQGFLTAFVDEDELMATGSVCRWLDAGGDGGQAAERWRVALRAAGYASVQDFGSEQFEPAMRAFLEREEHRLVPEARETVQELRAAGIELVLVSNSPTEKLRAMFDAIGVHEGDGLRLVGDARKWWIDGADPQWYVAGRRVHLDRPYYREIVARERPDLVIGDVASLDLAVPAMLRAEGVLDSAARLVLRRGPRSSAWATGQVDLAPDVRLVDEVVDSVAELTGILERA